MKATTRVLAKACYVVFGAGLLVAGASVLLIGAGLVPDTHRDAIATESRGDLNALHVGQEFGSLLVFVGLITFWFLRHYERSRFFHWSMTAFWGLFALVHWVDVRGQPPSVVGPLVTTVPFILFASVGLLRAATENDRTASGREAWPTGLKDRDRSGPHHRE
jgi:hypothetical protein